MPTIQIQLKEEEFVDAAKAASAPSQAWFLTAAVALLAVLMCLIWLSRTGHGRESIAGLGALVGTAVGGWIGRGLSIGAKAKRLFRQQKGLHRPYDLSWTTEAITLTAEHGTSRIQWPDFHKRRETDDQFLLFLSDANFLMVPKRAFPDTTLLGTFRDTVTDRIPAR
jgi:YcxB-like protein